MPIRLTEPAIRKAMRDAADTATRRDLADAGCPGLRLRMTPRGTSTWVLAVRDRAGAMRRFRLGTFPVMGVSEARAGARTLHVQVKAGADPIAERRRDRATAEAARQGVGTLHALFEIYATQRGNAQRTWGKARRLIELVFAPVMSTPLGKLNRGALQMLADSYPSQTSSSYAVRAIRPVLIWGAQRDYLAEDPARLHPPASVRRRQRVVSRDELARLLPVLAGTDRPHGPALMLMLLTLARREEVAGATWGEVDLSAGIWTLPPDRTKSDRAHSVQLSRQAVALMRARLPVDADGTNVAPDPIALIFANARCGKLVNWDRETKALQKASGTSNWHRHDLRRTGATMLGQMGIEPHIIEAALNHVSIGSHLAATYNTARYLPQVATALQRLADALNVIAAGDKVIELHTAASGG